MRDCELMSPDLHRLFQTLEGSAAFHELESLSLWSAAIRECLFKSFGRFLREARQLEVISIRAVKFDCSKLLKIILRSAPRLQVLKLVDVRFKFKIGSVDQLPTRLVHLNVSGSRSSIVTFRQLFELIGSVDEVAIPIAFEARDLLIDANHYDALSDLDFR